MSDPVDDFMAREQEMMAELEGDVPPPVDAPAVQDLADEFGALAAAPADPVFMNGGDSGVDLSAMDIPQVPVVNVADFMHVNGGGNGDGGSHSSNASGGLSPVPSMPRIEAENIRKWREQQAARLEKKDEAEEKKKGELRDASLQIAQAANRTHNAQLLASQQRAQTVYPRWDRVAELCGDLKTRKGTKDVSRLASLLSDLKTTAVHHYGTVSPSRPIYIIIPSLFDYPMDYPLSTRLMQSLFDDPEVFASYMSALAPRRTGVTIKCPDCEQFFYVADGPVRFNAHMFLAHTLN